jgi:L-malate glycosyltransferase
VSYHSIHIIGSRTSGGAERFYTRLVRQLAQMDCSPLALNPPGSAVAQEIASSADQQHLRMRNVWDPLARYTLRRLVKQYAPAVVQTYMGRATRILRMPNRSASVHVARLGGFYDIAGYRHADAWVGNAHAICDHLVRAGLPAGRVYHIGNFVEPGPEPPPNLRAKLCTDLDVPAEAWILTFAGRLHQNKGVAHLLQALANLPVTIGGRPLYALMAGSGPLASELEQLGETFGLAPRLRWLGWQAEPMPYYQVADLCVCPSIHEPLGNVVLEAWAYRRPILATSTSGPAELITHEDDGYLVAPADSQALAQGIHTLLTETDATRQKLGDAGLQTLKLHYSASNITGQYLQLYKTLARN